MPIRSLFLGLWLIAHALPAPPHQALSSTQAFQQTQPQPTRPFYQEMSWSRDSKRILFSGFHNNQADIWVMNADGSNVTQLTNHPAADLWGSFSPDGKRIVFQSKRDGPQEDIYVMNADGSNVTRLTTDAGRDIGPSWSPDGKRIAFSSSRDGGLQIYQMKTDGSEQTRLTDRRSEVRDQRSDIRDQKSEVTAQGGVRAPSNTANEGVRAPSVIKYYNAVWSPNGKRLAFYSETGDRKDQVVVINADGSGQTVLTGGVGNNIFPAWFADGKHIVFTSNRDGVDGAIYQVKLDGTELKRLWPDIVGFVVRPAPNGKLIGYLAGRYPISDIYTMNPDGTGVKKITK